MTTNEELRGKVISWKLYRYRLNTKQEIQYGFANDDTLTN